MKLNHGSRSLGLCCLIVCLASGSSYAKAPKGRFTVANGEVTDNTTGLIWRQAINPGAFTYDQAVAHCPTLGAGWRTPNVRELASIVDESTSFPAIDEEVFPGTPTANMWSSTPEAGDIKYAWMVEFTDGGTGVATKVTTLQVRCVR
jgi:hypothetical protein